MGQFLTNDVYAKQQTRTANPYFPVAMKSFDHLKQAHCLWLGMVLMFGLGSFLPHPCPPFPEEKPCPSVTPPLEVLEVSATVYYPTGDPTFDGTSIPTGKALEEVRWCALTHDLLKSTGWQWGDTVLVYGKNLPQEHWGLYILHDKTHSRLRNRIDLLTPNGTKSKRWDQVQVRKFTVNQ